jgi:hypothetical protein
MQNLSELLSSEVILEKLQALEVEPSSGGGAFRACSHGSFVAVANGRCLSMINLKSSADEDLIVAEIEFDNEIDAICWNPEGSVLVIADSSGTIHFVTQEGSLVYSRKMFQGTVKFTMLLCESANTSFPVQVMEVRPCFQQFSSLKILATRISSL